MDKNIYSIKIIWFSKRDRDFLFWEMWKSNVENRRSLWSESSGGQSEKSVGDAQRRKNLAGEK